ncbi:MAG: TonB-dependent siderophore receptor [Candidatus Pseudomonas phytovorans]|uniref:Metal-pseudopaline receptor CntO n=1 Tax=Candidatus Pseudomonas phytovorans TaxID=3121377 RepID=A0AAJ5WI28_9PSED|nr:TonB-dependent siderophore receptor [Pseudomonas sp.]WEK29100.1 MAG: TonB-dependent siderophore receptor [Pseudomonas sp.]
MPLLPLTLRPLLLALPLLAACPVMADDNLRHYDLPAGPLTQQLNRLASSAGIYIVGDGALSQGKASAPLQGNFTAEQALERMLQGSGLVAVPSGERQYRLQPAAQGAGLQLAPTSVDARRDGAYGAVDGYLATRASSASKTDSALLETPASVSVVTRDRIKAQGAQTITDALSYTAGVHTNVSGNNPTDNTLMVRGFQQITSDAYTDGLRNNNTGYYAPEPFGLERIEVLKGPASVIYGQGEPGGMINLVSKKPLFAAHREVGLSLGNHDRQQLSLDVGDLVDSQGTLAYRLVMLGRDADNEIDGIKDDRQYVAPSLTWAPNEDTSLTLLASYQKNTNLFTSNMAYSLFDGSNPNGRVPRHRSLNEPGFDREQSEMNNLGYELSHRFNETFSFRQNFRYSHMHGYQDQLFRNSGVINGNTLARYYELRDYNSDNYTLDNQLLANFSNGPLRHDLLLGVDYLRGHRSQDMQHGDAPSINIYNPARGISIDTSRYTSLLSTARDDRQTGLYLQDQLHLDNWVATLGVRHDWARQDSTNRIIGSHQVITDEATTARASFGYSFDMGLFPYVSYSESFKLASGNSFDGSPFEPETAKQYEVGIKYQPPGSEHYVTVAAFDLRRQNVATTDVDHPGFSVQQGEVTSRGLEVEGVAKPLPGLNLITAYTYNDVEVTKDNPNTLGVSNKGNTPVRVPRHLASMWVDYTLQGGPLAGLGAGIGVRYTGATYGDAQNTFEVPGYTLVDAMLSYDFGKANTGLQGLSAQLNVKNLTDKYYVAGCFATVACLLGSGRTVTADLTYRW